MAAFTLSTAAVAVLTAPAQSATITSAPVIVTDLTHAQPAPTLASPPATN